MPRRGITGSKDVRIFGYTPKPKRQMIDKGSRVKIHRNSLCQVCGEFGANRISRVPLYKDDDFGPMTWELTCWQKECRK